MTERPQLIRDARQRLVTFTELCALHGISRYRHDARSEAYAQTAVRLLGRGIPRLLRALQRHELIHQQESLPAAQVLIQRVGSRAFPFHD